jgi:hypothetical protein
MLYPVELQAHEVIRGGGIRTPDILLPKQARYQAALHPVLPNKTESENNFIYKFRRLC